MARQWLEDQSGQVGGWQSGQFHICVCINCGNNWGTRQTPQPRVPALGNKVSKHLTVKTCGGCGSGRNSQPHRRICWRHPLGPRMYSSLPTRKSASEGHNLVVGSGANDWKPAEIRARALFPLTPFPNMQCHNAVTWVGPPWRIPRALSLTITCNWCTKTKKYGPNEGTDQSSKNRS